MVFVDTPLPASLDLKPIATPKKVIGRPFGPDHPGGKPKGTRDKVVRGLREGILVAAERIGSDGNGLDGLIGFLEDLGRYHKKAFTSLLVKLLPMEPSILGDGVVRAGVNINIMSVDSGTYLSADTIARLQSQTPGQEIEHAPMIEPAPAEEPIVAERPAPVEEPVEPEQSPRLTELEAKLLKMDHAQLMELAGALNVGQGR